MTRTSRAANLTLLAALALVLPAPVAAAASDGVRLLGQAAASDSSTATPGEASSASNADAAGRTYTVVAGDTLSAIAGRLLGSSSRWPQIYAANRDVLDNPNTLRPGQVLRIPGSSGTDALAQAGGASPTNGTAAADGVAAANVAGASSPRAAGAAGSFNARNPLSGGRISSRFGTRVHPITGRRRLHAGVDIAVPLGTPIHATGAGIVIASGWAGGYGRVVKVRHADGTVTVYAHCRTLEVSRGQRVNAGQVVATVNSTGLSTGNHLHFEVQRGGRPVNPTSYFSLGGGATVA